MTAPGGPGPSRAQQRVVQDAANRVLSNVGRDRVFVNAATNNRSALERKVAEGLALYAASGRTRTNTFVYAVLHDSNGNFLLFRKNATSYFFKGKALSTRGQDLTRKKGGGKWALPGGGLDEVKGIEEGGQITRAHILAGAAREFHEETGYELARLLKLPARAHLWEDKTDVYTAGYFQAEHILGEIKKSVATMLAAGLGAAQAIESGYIRQRDNIHDYLAYKNAPLDNELSRDVETWNVNERWSEIDGWKRDENINWFANILEHLKDNVIRT